MSVATPPPGPSDNLGASILEGVRALLDGFRARIISGVAMVDRDVENRMYEQAALASAHYALERMTTARPIRQQQHPGNGHFELIEQALALVQVEGFHAEFGVFKGASLRFIADRIDKVVYGFDSFEGLPDDWSPTVPKGTFSLGGKAPDIAISLKNFRIVKGGFNEALPMFLSQVSGPAAFLHVDCHLHQSTKDIFDALEDRIQSGTVIVFRQYFNFPGWQSKQFKAFQDFCARSGRTYRYAAYTPTAHSVSVVID